MDKEATEGHLAEERARTRTWAEAGGWTFYVTTLGGGGMCVLASIFIIPAGWKSEALSVVSGLVGLFAFTIAWFFFNLALVARRQRDEARTVLRDFRTDRASRAIDRLRGIQFTMEADGADVLLEVRSSFARGSPEGIEAIRMIAPIVNHDEEAMGLAQMYWRALEELGIIEVHGYIIRDSRKIPAADMGDFGFEVCARLDDPNPAVNRSDRKRGKPIILTRVSSSVACSPIQSGLAPGDSRAQASP
jgi:hypothetical protein